MNNNNPLSSKIECGFTSFYITVIRRGQGKAKVAYFLPDGYNGAVEVLLLLLMVLEGRAVLI